MKKDKSTSGSIRRTINRQIYDNLEVFHY